MRDSTTETKKGFIGQVAYPTKLSRLLGENKIPQRRVYREMCAIRKEKIAQLVRQGVSQRVAEYKVLPPVAICTISRLCTGLKTNVYINTYERILEAINRIIPNYGATIDDIK